MAPSIVTKFPNAHAGHANLHTAKGSLAEANSQTAASKESSKFASVSTSSTRAAGGGTLRSSKEVLGVNPNTGTLTFSLPVKTSAGRAGSNVALSISYDSGGGNGELGVGWNMSADSISRKTSKQLPTYTNKDTFVWGSKDLIPKSGGSRTLHAEWDGGDESSAVYNVQEYLTAVLEDNSRIEHWVCISDPENSWWKITSPSNSVTIYGFTDNSRVSSSSQAEHGNQVFSWLSCYSYDPSGNSIKKTYKPEDAKGLARLVDSLRACEENRDPECRSRARYLKSITYGNKTPSRHMSTWIPLSPEDPQDWLFEVLLDYGEHDEDNPSTLETREWPVRADPFSTCTTGFEIRYYRLCRRVLMFHHFPDELNIQDYLHTSTTFTYDETAAASYLTRVTSYSHARDHSGAFLKRSLPHCSFTYTKAPETEQLSLAKLKMANLESLPGGQHLKSQWIDLEGCGSLGLLIERVDGTMAYQDNESSLEGDARLGQSTVVRSQLGRLSHEKFFEDLDRDGNVDLVTTDAKGRPIGFYPYRDSKWHSLQSFKSVASVNFKDAGVKRVDLTGDGLSDVVLLNSKQSDFTWHESLSKQGFGQSKPVRIGQQSPVRVAEDRKSSVQFADMTGDGLADLVRISNGQVVYWPNLGYGRFGKEVHMHNSPWMSPHEDFDSSRIVLADLDGYGPTDLMYFPRSGGVLMYTNQSGNSWDLRGKLSNFPKLDNVSNVSVVDLFGNGTSCLCWTGANYAGGGDSTLRYIDLFKGQKPHLLSIFENGAGRRTTVTYRPSTFYFQRDKQVGNPWKTKLPFAVQCVHELVDEDLLRGNKISTRYAYHDGDYDKQEKRFCGFRMVEQWDAETFIATQSPSLSTEERTFRRPPVHKKTWFHTNTLVEDADLSEAYDWGSLKPTPVTLLGSAAHNEESRRIACQALRGKPLLEETYADDGTQTQHIPYSAAWSSYDILTEQPSSQALRPVFRVNHRESMSIHSERQLSDHKISRQCVLGYNEFGQPTRAVSIAYGRSKAQGSLAILPTRASVRQAQEETVVEVSDVSYTNAQVEDSYNLVLPQTASKTSYRLRNLKLGADLPFECLRDTIELALKDLPLFSPKEADENPATACCVLVGKVQTYFRNNKLTETLKLGQMEIFSVVDSHYELLCSDSVTSPPFQIPEDIRSRLDISGLSFTAEDMGYTKLYLAGNELWRPSGKSFFAQPNANQLEAARHSFYQPTLYLDVFGNATVTTLDKYCLTSRQVTDSLGNISKVVMDYGTLKPSHTEDFNGNLTENTYGLLDHEVSTAIRGKSEEQVGDTLRGVDAMLSQEQVDAFIADPIASAPSLLKGASSRVIADMTRFLRLDGSLNFIATIARTQHFYEDSSGSSPITITVNYLDGHLETLYSSTLIQAGQKNQPTQWRIGGFNQLDNKGAVVRTYRPYFSDSHLVRMDVGASKWDTTIFLDPLGREVATLHSDHSWSKTVFSPWSIVTYDQSDTVHIEDCALDEHVGSYFNKIPRQDYFPSWYETQHMQQDLTILQRSRAARSLQGCLSLVNTPTVVHVDSLGRPISTTSDFGGQNATSSCVYGASGTKLKDFDALGREVQRASSDLLQRSTLVSSMDSGQVHVIYNALDQAILSWNSKGVYTRSRYDALARNTELWVADGSSQFQLTTKFTYGEALENATQLNLRGQVSRIEDQSGLLSFPSYDFKGRCTETFRTFCKEFKSIVDWANPVELEEESFAVKNWTDCQGRIIRSLNARGDDELRSYDLAGQLLKVKWKGAGNTDWINFQTGAEYDADGNRIKTNLGNGVEEIVLRDPDTNNIIRKTTIQPGGTRVQDKLYTLDSSGRTVYVVDHGQDVAFFRNAQVQADSIYTYDGMGRLTSATGREQISDKNGIGRSFKDSKIASSLCSPGVSSFESSCAYRETYDYDLANRIISLTHEPIGDTKAIAWCRKYYYEECSSILEAPSGRNLSPTESNNRISRTEVGDATEIYKYEGPDGVAGCVTSMLGLPMLLWNYHDQLRASSTQICNSGVPEMTYYVYDHTGTRVRKVTERSSAESSSGKGGARMRDTKYIGALQIARTFAGDGQTLKCERFSSYVYGDERIAAVENSDIAKYPVKDLMRYEFDGLFELDDQGSLVSWNEYAPFGAKTFSACRSDVEAPSIYRYCRYEQDSETNLYCAGARYYASWMCRWLSPDPIGIQDGMERYAYADNDPINLEDQEGTSTSPKPDKSPSRGGDGARSSSSSSSIGNINDLPTVSSITLDSINSRESSSSDEESLNNRDSDPGSSYNSLMAKHKMGVPYYPKKKPGIPIKLKPIDRNPSVPREARSNNPSKVPVRIPWRPTSRNPGIPAPNMARQLTPLKTNENRGRSGFTNPNNINPHRKLTPVRNATPLKLGPSNPSRPEGGRGRTRYQDHNADAEVLQDVQGRYAQIAGSSAETIRARYDLIASNAMERVSGGQQDMLRDQLHAMETNQRNFNDGDLESWSLMLNAENTALGTFLEMHPPEEWVNSEQYDAASQNLREVRDLLSKVDEQVNKRYL